ncbi:MAG: 30S ribosomal protein S9 [uncultured bacterium]|nr:MAG: 30S ribosomal protein S9 [uncultured bacterium]
MNKEVVEKVKLSGKYFEAVGRRKRAVARVRLYTGKGQFYKNNQLVSAVSSTINSPLILVGLVDKFDISIKVVGGGIKSQEEAVRHALSRALVKFDETLKPSLRKAGFMTRDPREKERKKPGLKRARRAPQWQKR